jgi:deoxyribodipyrimidine photo-lyase
MTHCGTQHKRNYNPRQDSRLLSDVPGQKIIEWSETYQQALDAVIYCTTAMLLTDGIRTQMQTSSGVRLHDRPLGDRRVVGQVRFMSYDGMKHKTDIAPYIDEIRALERTGKDPVSL